MEGGKDQVMGLDLPWGSCLGFFGSLHGFRLELRVDRVFLLDRGSFRSPSRFGLDDFTAVLRFLLPARLGAGSFEDTKVARLVRNFLTPCSSKSMRRYASSTAITDPKP